MGGASARRPDGLAVELFSGIGNPGHSRRQRAASARWSRLTGPSEITTPSRPPSRGARRVGPSSDHGEGRGAPPGLGGACSANLLVLDVEMEAAEGCSELEALLDTLTESDAARRRSAIHEGLHG